MNEATRRYQLKAVDRHTGEEIFLYGSDAAIEARVRGMLGERLPGDTVPTPGTGLTTDPIDPRLPVRHGFDEAPMPQQPVYLVLSEEERARGFVRPLRKSYLHQKCGHVTTMGQALAETYARQPSFYRGTYCATCRMHRPVAEFTWIDGDGRDTGEGVGS